MPSLVYLPAFRYATARSRLYAADQQLRLRSSLTTLAVGTHTISARYSGDANYSADTSAGVAVTVNQAASATAATSSVNPSFAGQSVTLTANVTSAGPTPTGNVTFTSGSTTLASVALSGGSASYTTSSFTTVGTQTITVSYAGDANTQASSTSLSQVVNAAFNTAPGGSGSTTLTVKAGQTVSAPINVTGAAGFSGPVTFACSGLPANSSCSFSPATITVSGSDCCIHSAFCQYDRDYDGQPAEIGAWRVWTCIRWAAFVLAGPAQPASPLDTSYSVPSRSLRWG